MENEDLFHSVLKHKFLAVHGFMITLIFVSGSIALLRWGIRMVRTTVAHGFGAEGDRALLILHFRSERQGTASRSIVGSTPSIVSPRCGL